MTRCDDRAPMTTLDWTETGILLVKRGTPSHPSHNRQNLKRQLHPCPRVFLNCQVVLSVKMGIWINNFKFKIYSWIKKNYENNKFLLQVAKTSCFRFLFIYLFRCSGSCGLCLPEVYRQISPLCFLHHSFSLKFKCRAQPPSSQFLPTMNVPLALITGVETSLAWLQKILSYSAQSSTKLTWKQKFQSAVITIITSSLNRFFF